MHLAIAKINGNAKLLPNVTLVLAMQTYHTQTDAVQKGIALLNRIGRYFVSGWALTVPSSNVHQTIPIDSVALSQDYWSFLCFGNSGAGSDDEGVPQTASHIFQH